MLPFKSKYLTFTVVGNRKYEVRVKGNDRVVAHIFGQAGNGHFRYVLRGREGHQSQQYNEKGIVRALTLEILSEDYL